MSPLKASFGTWFCPLQGHTLHSHLLLKYLNVKKLSIRKSICRELKFLQVKGRIDKNGEYSLYNIPRKPFLFQIRSLVCFCLFFIELMTGKQNRQCSFQSPRTTGLLQMFIYLGFYVAFNTVQVISRWVVGRTRETSTYS